MLERVNVSLGTASVLGLSHARLQEIPSTAHLMVGIPYAGQGGAGKGCINDCSFCTQARSSVGRGHNLSRVTWPGHERHRLLQLLGEALDNGMFRRVCVQTVESPHGTQETLELIRGIRNLSSDIPVSVCAFPYSASRVARFLRQGATNVGLPIDAVTPEIYRQVKGACLDKAWEVLENCARLWPGRISTHFIAGLGESERDMVRSMARAQRSGITVGLFAFTPVRGTALENLDPPPVDSYRRVQLAAYLLKIGKDPACIGFDGGRVARISVTEEQLRRDILEGRPFETSGCPGCNRPYYNERPGQVMMNYPRKLTPDEAASALYASRLFSEEQWALKGGGGVR